MKYGILGYGYVGKATHLGLLQSQNCLIHDTNLGTNSEILNDADVVFVCIPTTTDSDVHNLIQEVCKLARSKNTQIVVRSTLPVGTCKTLKEISDIIYIPEFLRERFYETDCMNRPLVVGYDGERLPDWLSKEETIHVSTVEAELIKLFSNNYAVLTIAFANIFHELSTKMGADYDNVRKAYEIVRPDQSYLEVPGHDGKRGFGGKCLPKDLDFLTKILEQCNIDHELFDTVKRLNDTWRKS